MPEQVFEQLKTSLQSATGTIEDACLGLTWSYCEYESDKGASVGFAQSPTVATRTLAWPGSLRGSAASQYEGWLDSWDSHQSTMVQALCNAIINNDSNALMRDALTIAPIENPNLAVFEHFADRLVGKKVVIIGHYPGIETLSLGDSLVILERQPQAGDLPDSAAEYVIPEADWVFISGTTLINKTFPRLAALAENAVSVLMGPSVPWLLSLQDYAIDYLAGVRVIAPKQAKTVAREGGGVGLFKGPVEYAVANISKPRLAKLKQQISETYERRESLKSAMNEWYSNQNGSPARFPQRKELEQTDITLSLLDSVYKRLWDATNRGTEPCL